MFFPKHSHAFPGASQTELNTGRLLYSDFIGLMFCYSLFISASAADEPLYLLLRGWKL